MARLGAQPTDRKIKAGHLTLNQERKNIMSKRIKSKKKSKRKRQRQKKKNRGHLLSVVHGSWLKIPCETNYELSVGLRMLSNGVKRCKTSPLVASHEWLIS